MSRFESLVLGVLPLTLGFLWLSHASMVISVCIVFSFLSFAPLYNFFAYKKGTTDVVPYGG